MTKIKKKMEIEMKEAVSKNHNAKKTPKTQAEKTTNSLGAANKKQDQIRSDDHDYSLK